MPTLTAIGCTKLRELWVHATIDESGQLGLSPFYPHTIIKDSLLTSL